MRETIRRADNEGIEGELWVQVRGNCVGAGVRRDGGTLSLLFLLVVRGRGGGRRNRRGSGGFFFFLLLFLRFHEFQGRIDRDGDAYGAPEVHGQGGRQLVLRLIFDPLLREAVRDGQEDRPFDIAERARGAQHRRRNGPSSSVGTASRATAHARVRESGSTTISEQNIR